MRADGQAIFAGMWSVVLRDSIRHPFERSIASRCVSATRELTDLVVGNHRFIERHCGVDWLGKSEKWKACVLLPCHQTAHRASCGVWLVLA